MAIPILLLALATLSAAVVAYGTHPALGGLESGLNLIVLSRRLEWWLVALSVVLCLTLIALIILGKRRAWWLIGLGPILALFVHHFAPFAPDRAGAMTILENPVMVNVKLASAGGAAAAVAPADEDWVVGVNFGDTAYAYPYAVLFHSPVVIQSEHGNHMALFWSAYANRAVAVRITDAIRARDLEVVSEPANALLVYDTRRGEFINGLKGLYLNGREPPGFGRPLLTTKTTWKQWRSANPAGKVMAWNPTAAKGGSPAPAAPTRPLIPAYTVPGRNGGRPVAAGGASRSQATLVGWPHPQAVDGSLLGRTPVNLSPDGTPAMVFRPDPAGAARAFALPDPKAEKATTHPAVTAGALPPRFVLAPPNAAHPTAVVREVSADTLWTADGTGVPKTPSAGMHLKPMPVDEDVDRATIQFWYPGLHVLGGE